MKSIMNNIIIKEEKDKKDVTIKKDLNFFKGEPVKTEYGEGYVVNENLVDFIADEKYDIYDDLKKEDELRVENLNKKYKKEDSNNKQENEKGIKENNKAEEEEKNKSDKQENNKINEDNNKKGKEKEEEIKANKQESNNKEDNNKDQKSNEINENKIIEKKEVNKNIINDTTEEINTNSNMINNNEKLEKEKQKSNNSLPEYYNNFLEIKFDYGKGWIHKKNVEKYNVLQKQKEEEKGKKLGGLFSIFK
jgi:hypothetical protein